MENLDESLRHGWHHLLFGVRRSARYHCRRAQFYENLGYALSFLSIIFGGGAVFATRTDSVFVKAGGGIIAIFSALNVVLGYSKSAREHRDFESKFNALEKEMAGAGISPSANDLVRCKQARLEIEEKEPGKMCGLDAVCHNEIIVSMGLDRQEMADLKWYHRLFCQFVNFDGDKLKKFKESGPQIPTMPQTALR